MTRVRAVLLLCLLGWPLWAPADAVREALDACYRTVDAQPVDPKVKPGEEPAVDVGKSCPDLRPVIEDSEYGPWLPHEWWDALKTREQLAELDHLLYDDSAQPQPTAAPDANNVSSVLKGLQQEISRRELSMWERFVQWVWRRLQRQEDEERPSWLKQWLQKINISDDSARLISRILFALIVFGALLAILNELRAAGVLGKKQREARERAALATAGIEGHVLTLADVDAAALRLQPSLLLDLLLARLSREQKIAGDHSLTHRQLRGAVRMHGERHQEQFDDLVGCAERTRYAGVEPTNEELAGAVASGRQLLESVSAELRNEPR